MTFKYFQLPLLGLFSCHFTMQC